MLVTLGSKFEQHLSDKHKVHRRPFLAPMLGERGIDQVRLQKPIIKQWHVLLFSVTYAEPPYKVVFRISPSCHAGHEGG
jgi:hypothetical protein